MVKGSHEICWSLSLERLIYRSQSCRGKCSELKSYRFIKLPDINLNVLHYAWITTKIHLFSFKFKVKINFYHNNNNNLHLVDCQNVLTSF